MGLSLQGVNFFLKTPLGRSGRSNAECAAGTVKRKLSRTPVNCIPIRTNFEVV